MKDDGMILLLKYNIIFLLIMLTRKTS